MSFQLLSCSWFFWRRIASLAAARAAIVRVFAKEAAGFVASILMVRVWGLWRVQLEKTHFTLLVADRMGSLGEDHLCIVLMVRVVWAWHAHAATANPVRNFGESIHGRSQGSLPQCRSRLPAMEP